MADRLRDEVSRLRREAAVLEAQALVLRRAADSIEAGMARAERLSEPQDHSERNLKIAAWHPSTPLSKAAQARGLTLRGLARAIGVSPASLTHYQKGRPVPRSVAEKVRELTGFSAWPGGVVD